MPPKMNQAWKDLQAKMTQKRTKQQVARVRKGNKASPSELVVQRLTAEPDNKQTYRPVQPREFVEFVYDELTLENLKQACADHFGLPVHTCDVLVSNKGPSCTNINQIPHRKDKVYLVRFVVNLEPDDGRYKSIPLSVNHDDSDEGQGPAGKRRRQNYSEVPKSYPASVSIEQLLRAGKFVKPPSRTRATFSLESFDLVQKEWKTDQVISLSVDDEKFASGAFRDAFKGISGDGGKKMWVVKQYNEQSKRTIQETITSTVEVHTRKQIQMHTVARELTKNFTSAAPPQFGHSFCYNKAYYSQFNGEPVTVEEFVPGVFTKYVNNDGKCIIPNTEAPGMDEIFDKAQCLVHFTYTFSDQKMMLLDIQGSQYILYDPEIATSNLIDDAGEIFFCCGNLSSKSIETFLDDHICNRFCDMLNL